MPFNLQSGGKKKKKKKKKEEWPECADYGSQEICWRLRRGVILASKSIARCSGDDARIQAAFRPNA